MTKFNVDDIVRGNSSVYGITNYSMTKGIVTGILSDFGAIKVKRLEKDGRPITDSCEYPVEAQYFTLVERAKPKHTFSKGDQIRVNVSKSKFGKPIDTTQPHTYMGSFEGQASINAPGDTSPIGRMLVPMSAIEPWVPTFKIGDKVRGLATGLEIGYSITNVAGTTLKIVDVDTSGRKKESIRVKVLSHKEGHWVGHSFWVEPQYFELVEQGASSFKVGDLVRGLATSDRKYSITNSKMTIGKIIGVDPERSGNKTIHVKVVNHSDNDCKRFIGDTYWVDPQYFELTKQEESKPTFRVGDLVRGTAEESRYYVTNKHMALAEVTSVDGATMSVKVLAHEKRPELVGQSYDCVQSRYFAKVEPSTTVKVGDKVRSLTGRSMMGFKIPTSVDLIVDHVAGTYVDVRDAAGFYVNSLDNGTFVVVQSAPVKTDLQLAQERITELETQLTSTKSQLANAQRKLDRIESVL